ncbi:MAG: hypothetical protein LN412_01350, partial [Candidatus Thermoplasmatota archaeon]|nr:hypothetical protein [Candidatus Thermoplasmatota archaeon]
MPTEEQKARMTVPRILFSTSPEQVGAVVEKSLSQAKQILKEILAVDGLRTVADTLVPFNNLLIKVGGVSS